MHLRHRLLKHRWLEVLSSPVQSSPVPLSMHLKKSTYLDMDKYKSWEASCVGELGKRGTTGVKYKVRTIDELEDGSRIQEMRLVLVQDQ